MRSIRLSEAARIYSGNSINERVKAQNYMGLNEGTPYIATKDISYGFLVNYENGVKIPHSKSAEFKLAKKGSVLLCAEGGSAGRKMAIIDRDVFFVNKLFCFECDAQLNSRYLFYYLQTSIFQDLVKNSITGIIGGVSLEKVRNLPMILPSLEKQREIVEKLDKAFAEIDLLERNFELSEENANELLQSIMNFHFSSGDQISGLDHPSAIPGNVMKLEKLTSIQTGKIDVNKAIEGGKYPFFTCSRDVYEINDAPFEGKAVLVAGNGDLNVKYYEGKFNAYQRTYFLFVNDENELIPKYLYWFLESYVDQLRSESIGSTIKYIKMGNLTNAEIPLPSLSKQLAIVEKLDSAFAEIERLKAQIKFEKDYAIALRQSLLSSAFSQEKVVA